jgi:hypothetical protein
MFKTPLQFRVLTKLCVLISCCCAGAAENPLVGRVASVYISQDFINEQLAAHSKSDLIKEMKVDLNPDNGQIFLRGKIQVPIEELRAVNLDPSLGVFRFQVAIKPETTKHGHLILEFPLSETYFYPATSKDPKNDRVIIPVQLLSLALASARGYLAALSGDFSGFDRRTAKLNALLKGVKRLISAEKNADALADLKNQKTALELQIAAIPIERRQLETVSKEVAHVLGFTGEKELNLNNELGARRNALVLKIKLSQLVPYLKDVELGGVRLRRDKKDGNGENFLAIDVTSQLESAPPPTSAEAATPRPPMKIAPSLIMRLNQALFESESVIQTEKQQMGTSLRDFAVVLKDDGLHVSGKWHKLFFSLPFETTVDFVSTAPDVFEVRVRELEVEGMDFQFLTKYVLEAMKARLDTALHGICKFRYLGEENDKSRALQVKIDPKSLVPAFPDLHLVAVDVRSHEFLLKIGRIQ